MINLLWAFLGTVGAVLLFLALGALLWRSAFDRFTDRLTMRLFKDKYSENLWEMVSTLTKIPPQTAVETSLRAQEGMPIRRPLGSPRRFLKFEGLMFSPAQVSRLPLPEDEAVDTSVVLGPNARKPLVLSIPVMLGAMAHGLALSEEAKIALGKASTLAGTATNSGEGGFFPPEREAARHYILQYDRGGWTRDPEILRKADMIEVQVGQGSDASAPKRTPSHLIPSVTRELLGLKQGEDALIHARLPEVNDPEDFVPLVRRIKEQAGGIPVGIKMMASDELEQDLAVCLRAGFDVITLDGAQGGTRSSEPTFQDDFGLPTVYAIPRAARFLRRHGVDKRVSLVAAGGLFTPGDFMKALALGADAVSIGSIALLAMTHNQVTKSMPWEPPTELVYEEGRLKHHLDGESAARYIANFLRSCIQEMEAASRAMGKRSFAEFSLTDLCALDELTARVTGARLAYPLRFETRGTVKANRRPIGSMGARPTYRPEASRRQTSPSNPGRLEH
ncbi:MAG: FMN-binding glutamate synthase family protein [Firmicutes bacterium]|nr:FMN-binding glutamate synthase family protein [Bacillota bacterium]